MRAQIVDIPAWTPPYDHALCSALARAGADVELVTSYFPFGPVPRGEGYRVSESFYRAAGRMYRREGGYLSTFPEGAYNGLRRAMKMIEHVPDLLAYRRRARSADIVHYQWLTSESIDVHLLPPKTPRVFTSHNIVPRTPRRGDLGAMPRLLEKMDAVVVHSQDGARRLSDTFGVDGERVHVIPHGAFDYLTKLEREDPLPPEFQSVEGPVILFFGLIRSYKGVDLLIDAFADVPDAELWVVGMPHIDMEPLRALSDRAPGRVRFLPRFLPESAIPAFFRRADVVALPYTEIDQSGVLYTAIAFGKAIVLSSVGGFQEVADDHGAGVLVPPGDRDALAAALIDLTSRPERRRDLERAAAAAASETYSWDAIGRRTFDLYRRLLGDRA